MTDLPLHWQLTVQRIQGCDCIKAVHHELGDHLAGLQRTEMELLAVQAAHRHARETAKPATHLESELESKRSTRRMLKLYIAALRERAQRLESQLEVYGEALGD